MKLHFEVGGPAPTTWPDLRGRGALEQARALARGLARRGHAVSWRCAPDPDGTPAGVYAVPSHGFPPVCDALIAVNGAAVGDIQADRRVAWSWGGPRQLGGLGWDAIAAQQPHLARQLAEHLPRSRVVGIPAAVPMHDGSAPPRHHLLYAARPEHGLHILLSMWPAIWDALHMPLLVAGDLRTALAKGVQREGPIGDRLRALEQLVQQPGVIPMGSLDAQEWARVRARSLAVLQPVDPALPEAGQGCFPLLECCAAGCAPVVAAQNGLGEAFAGAGWTIEPDQAQRPWPWLEAIEEALEDPARSEAEARAFAAEHSLDAALDAWEALLRDLRIRSPQPRPPQPLLSLVVAARGTAPGERADLRALLAAAAAGGHTIVCYAQHEDEAHALADVGSTVLDPQGHGLLAACQGQPSRLLLCGRELQALLPRLAQRAKGIPTALLDVSWPGWLRSAKGADAADLVLSTLPPAVADAGGERGSLLAGPARGGTRCTGRFRLTRPARSAAGSAQIRILGTSSRALRRAVGGLALLRQERRLQVTSYLREDASWLPAWVTRADGERPPGLNVEAGPGLVIWAGYEPTACSAIFTGWPVLLLSEGSLFRHGPPSAAGEVERWAQALHLAGLAEHLPGLLPPALYARTVAALLEEASGVIAEAGAQRAVLALEAMQAPSQSRTWTPRTLVA